MFFELDDVQRRHNPSWWTNNVTTWHTAVDSTPSWNYQRGLIIGSIVGPLQQYLTHFIQHAGAMLKHYEPPTSLTQWSTFIRQTRNLQSFNAGFKSRMYQGLAVGAVSIAPTLAVFRWLNSGWSANSGGFQYSFYRKIGTIAMATCLTAPFGTLVDMVGRAYHSDKTFPKQLQKGYKHYLDAFKRIPFQEGPYYLFKNTFPFYVKHAFGPFTCLFFYDFLIDKMSVLWRNTNMPILPCVLFAATFSTYLGAVFTYPFAQTIRQMVDIWPKKGGDPFNGNYRKGAVYFYFSTNGLNFYPGFFKNYFWHIAPQWFLTTLLAQKFGFFKYWRIDIFSGAADNSNEDSIA